MNYLFKRGELRMKSQNTLNKENADLIAFSDYIKCHQNQILIHHLLNHYASLLEYHLSTYPKAEQPVFDEAHYTLFRNKLGLVNSIIDQMDTTV